MLIAIQSRMGFFEATVEVTRKILASFACGLEDKPFRSVWVDNRNGFDKYTEETDDDMTIVAFFTGTVMIPCRVVLLATMMRYTSPEADCYMFINHFGVPGLRYGKRYLLRLFSTEQELSIKQLRNKAMKAKRLIIEGMSLSIISVDKDFLTTEMTYGTPIRLSWEELLATDFKLLKETVIYEKRNAVIDNPRAIVKKYPDLVAMSLTARARQIRLALSRINNNSISGCFLSDPNPQPSKPSF